MPKQNLPPVCISGMGCVCSAGSQCHELLYSNTTLSNPSLLHKDSMPYAFFAAPAEAFGAGRSFSARDTLNLALHATKQAIAQARLLEGQAHESCGIILGTTAGSALHFLDGYAKMRDNNFASTSEHEIPNEKLPEDIEDFFNSNLALNIAKQFNLQGPALTIANACTSGADAIGMGMDMILQDQCSAVLCGGADALSLVPHTGFARLMIYSNELCKPFDANRKGLNLGEGAGIVVLEKTEHALARGIKPLGFVVGYGGYADAHHFTAPHPQARGLDASINFALKQANITKEQLAFINAHGTATPENDKVEGKYFHENMPNIPVWGSKSITGHTLGAAGAIEAIFCLLALNNKEVPATRGFEAMDQEIGLTPTTQNIRLQKDCALSTSLGFGGSNAALIVKGACND